MTHEYYQACIEACQDCANACDHCATACLAEDDVADMADCIALDLDCAQICRLAVSAMARDSSYANAICLLCADVCDACADECAQHDHDHCQDCAEACRRCADACRKMSGPSGQPEDTQRQTMGAH